jgi:prefoldin subunit 5
MGNFTTRRARAAFLQTLKLVSLTLLAITFLCVLVGDHVSADDAVATPPLNHPSDDALSASAAGATCANDAVVKRIAWLNEDDDLARAAIDALYVRVGRIENEIQAIFIKYRNVGMGDDYIGHLPRVSELYEQEPPLNKEIETLKNRRKADQAEIDALSSKPPCVDRKSAPVAGETNALPPPAPPANPPAPIEPTTNSASTICQHCQWIRIQISDIDEKIAGWERQIATLNKISDLSDPNIQNALKDIANRITALKAKKADLQVQLADCAKHCADAQKKAALKPATPSVPPGTSSGPGTNNNAGSGETTTADSAVAPPGAKKITFPIPFVPCPPDAPKETPVSKPSDKNIERPVLPPNMTLPPAPKDPKDKQDWDDLLLDMQMTEFIGDMDDVWSTAEGIDDAIETANNDLAFDPQDDDARERLEWLEAQRDYYDRWRAYINVKWPRLRIEPRTIRRCYLDPEWLRQFREQVRPAGEHSSDDHYNSLGNFRFGVDLEGGHGDQKDDGDRKYKPLKDDGDRKPKPPMDDKPHD